MADRERDRLDALLDLLADAVAKRLGERPEPTREESEPLTLPAQFGLFPFRIHIGTWRTGV